MDDEGKRHMMTMLRQLAACIVAMTVFSGIAVASGETAPDNAYLYIGWPNDGEVLPANRPFRVWFGLRNMGVAPSCLIPATITC
jgi:hypothetical protein